MREFVKGMLARSKAGHDTGKLYVVMDADTEYVYLADGVHRTVDNTKKKRESTFRLSIKFLLFFRSLWKKEKKCRTNI